MTTKTVPLCDAGDIADGSLRGFTVDGREIVLVRFEGALYALDGHCPHQGGPLAEGELVGDELVCPWHGWSFRVVDGKGTWMEEQSVACFPVHVEDGKVFVEIAEGKS